jgi:LEA14-like dessication related protein
MRRLQVRIAAAFAVVLIAVSASCSIFVPKLEPPALSVVSIELGRSNLFVQHLKVRIHVANPNDRALPIEGLSYVLDVAGAEAARGASSASFTVPPLGDAEFEMDVTANLADTLLRLLSRASPSGQIDYRIVGKVRLAHGLLRSIPFDERGTLTLR